MGIKAGFNRARAKVNDDIAFNSKLLGGTVALLGGMIMIPFDFGATCAFGAAILAESYRDTKINPWTHSYYARDYNGTYAFDGKTYYLGKNQYAALRTLDYRIGVMETEFNQTPSAESRKKLNKKIQKLVDVQKDILRSKNISTTAPETVELTVDRSMTKKKTPSPN